MPMFALRKISSVSGRSRAFRHIMTTGGNVQKIMEDLQTNPYYDKYAKRIAEMRKNSPEQFMNRIEQKESSKQSTLEKAERRYTPVLNPKAPLKETTAPPQEKKLEDIFKIDLVKDKSAEEIIEIWSKYYIQKDVIAATIPSLVYKKTEDRISKYPTFLFPLPRTQGYEFIMCQASGNVVHFTTLLCYQVHKENAPECLTIVHYKELMEHKGIVLMKGEFDQNVINAQEAQCLANQFQMYYSQDNESKLNLLEMFTKKPEQFKHMDLIAQLESLEISKS